MLWEQKRLKHPVIYRSNELRFRLTSFLESNDVSLGDAVVGAGAGELAKSNASLLSKLASKWAGKHALQLKQEC